MEKKTDVPVFGTKEVGSVWWITMDGKLLDYASCKDEAKELRDEFEKSEKSLAAIYKKYAKKKPTS